MMTAERRRKETPVADTATFTPPDQHGTNDDDQGGDGSIPADMQKDTSDDD